jgi:hypothetical protein
MLISRAAGVILSWPACTSSFLLVSAIDPLKSCPISSIIVDRRKCAGAVWNDYRRFFVAEVISTIVCAMVFNDSFL